MRSGYRFVSATDTLMTRHAPLKMTASQMRPLRARMNEPTNVAHHTEAPRRRTNTVGSLAASPASTCVIQLFTRIARWVSLSWKVDARQERAPDPAQALAHAIAAVDS